MAPVKTLIARYLQHKNAENATKIIIIMNKVIFASMMTPIVYPLIHNCSAINVKMAMGLIRTIFVLQSNRLSALQAFIYPLKDNVFQLMYYFAYKLKKIIPTYAFGVLQDPIFWQIKGNVYMILDA